MTYAAWGDPVYETHVRAVLWEQANGAQIINAETMTATGFASAAPSLQERWLPRLLNGDIVGCLVSKTGEVLSKEPDLCEGLDSVRCTFRLSAGHQEARACSASAAETRTCASAAAMLWFDTSMPAIIWSSCGSPKIAHHLPRSAASRGRAGCQWPASR